MAARRHRLAARRKTLGFTQESLAAEVGTDRTTVARWERFESDPQPFNRSRLAKVLQVSMSELDSLLIAEERAGAVAAPDDSAVPPVEHRAVSAPKTGSDELDDMNRRELLRLLSITGALVTVPNFADTDDAHADDLEQIEHFEALNTHLWQVFALSDSKRKVYPVVRQQLELLNTNLDRARSEIAHQRLCVVAGDLFQLAGEILFDVDRYTDAAHCYTLAADASRQGGAFDLWACALTRHAYVGMYERRYAKVAPMLEAAGRVARRGDSQLSTQHWVAAVRAEAYAGLGDFDACQRALDEAERVRDLTGPVAPGGWLRFTGSRLAEERGTCYAALGRTDLAEDTLKTALRVTTSPRRRGSVLTDLATLGAQRRDFDQIAEYGGQAVDLAERTHSSGYIGRKLGDLQTKLSPFLTDRRAAQLNDRIANLRGEI